MIVSGRRLLREWRTYRRFRELERGQRAIVFYAEDETSWPHLGPYVEEIRARGHEICYVTSSSTDPIVRREDPGCNVFVIGSGACRTIFFATLECNAFVMTMPDLNQGYLKRSKAHPVHYVYAFHSIVSTHMVYRGRAFDAYDSVLCAGPHHVRELRAAEESFSTTRKHLVNCGYPRLESIRRKSDVETNRAASSRAGKLHVLIAPSWGPTGLLETIGVELVQVLLDAGLRVTVRPHPMTSKKWPEKIDGLRPFERHDGFVLDHDIVSQDSLHASDVMVSDWSGVAYEYAFGVERPVVFIDVARKVNNPQYKAIPLEPMEVAARAEVGCVVNLTDLSTVPALATALHEDRRRLVATIREARAKYTFPLGSVSIGADHILSIAKLRQFRLERA